ncbi:MAG: cytochrome c-type biogenesis protein CcmH [Pseudomonadales bacterium]|nr:cytochrome c-type biogenesis protein CcmH [Pseudomonadales bacterium]
MTRLLVLVASCFFCVNLSATILVYEFEDEDKREQFDELAQELRCPKCQNQNIADSDAGVAKLIKDRVYKLVKEGKTKQEITDHMVDRYGDFVTYRPPVRKSTFLLWFGPVVFLVVAIIGLLIFIRANNAKKEQRAPKALSQEEQQKVQALLKQYESDKDQNSPN